MFAFEFEVDWFAGASGWFAVVTEADFDVLFSKAECVGDVVGFWVFGFEGFEDLFDLLVGLDFVGLGDEFGFFFGVGVGGLVVDCLVGGFVCVWLHSFLSFALFLCFCFLVFWDFF